MAQQENKKNSVKNNKKKKRYKNITSFAIPEPSQLPWACA